METSEYRTVDKSSWGEGAWQDEPDKKQFMDKATGLPCLIVRSRVGSLCGYVGVTEGHPLFGKGYDDADGILIHGGLTFSDFCHDSSKQTWEKWRAGMMKRKAKIKEFPHGDDAEAWSTYGHLVDDYEAWLADHECTSICHKPSDGESDHVWWFGFDTAHAGDLSPAMEAKLKVIMPDRAPKPTTGMLVDTYKDISYVMAECRDLAKQLKEIDGTAVAT